MGTIKSGILGGFSGKVGGVVGTSWKGIPVMKAMPQSVANPRTNLQVAQRDTMSQVVAVAGLLLANVIKPLWDRFAQKMSGYNAFVSANIAKFMAIGLVEPEGFVISRGKMAATPMIPSGVSAGVRTVVVSWSSAIADAYQQEADEAYLVAYADHTKLWAFPDFPGTRAVETMSVTFPKNLQVGEFIHFYLAFRRSDGTIVSETSYALGVVGV